jgi:hypothetical protein
MVGDIDEAVKKAEEIAKNSSWKKNKIK